MRKQLPARPNLEHLKSQAKDLLEAFQRGDAEAVARVRDALPSNKPTLALHDAQSAVAREYGFASWNELRAEVERAENVRALMQPHLASPLPDEVQRALTNPVERTKKVVPAESPVIALRNAALSVGARVPLNIGRPASLAAIDAAERNGNVLAVFAQRSEVTEDPSVADLHPVGCAVELLHRHASADRGHWIVIRAFEWVRLDAVEETVPYLRARVSRFEVRGDSAPEVARLERELRKRVHAFANQLPHAAQILRATETMSAGELADLAIANLPCSVADKAQYASEPELAARLAYLLALFERAA